MFSLNFSNPVWALKIVQLTISQSSFAQPCGVSPYTSMAQYSAAVSEILTKTSGVLVLCGTFPVVLCPANPSLLCLSEFGESTMLCVGFPSLSSSLQSDYGQKSKGILGFTSFVFPFLGVIVSYCLSTNVSEWLIHTFLSTFLVLWGGVTLLF